MPELIEVDSYRDLADTVLGRRIAAVRAPDAWMLKNDTSAEELDTLVGSRFVAARRKGKRVLLDTDDGRTLGLRFGMTGVLEVDGVEGVDDLQYASRRRDPAWIRLEMTFEEGGHLRLRDSRRLGGIELDPDETALGPDATTITLAELRDALDSTAPLKARLMDQHRVAGLGNLLTDEILWRAGLDPARPAESLSPAERRRLHRHIQSTLDELIDQGGSHLGRLQPAREPGASCPKDGATLERRTIGGRTTYSCPVHQR